MAPNNPGSPSGNKGGNQGGKSNRGFASMDPQRQREIASEGGRAAHQKGTAHEFTSEEARRAGSKGGHAAHERGTAHEFDSQEAREAGRKGGQASAGSHHAAPADASPVQSTSEVDNPAGDPGGKKVHRDGTP